MRAKVGEQRDQCGVHGGDPRAGGGLDQVVEVRVLRRSGILSRF